MKVTNGEIIRKLLNGCNITDEELAKIRICPYNISETCAIDMQCDDCRLTWLKKDCSDFQPCSNLRLDVDTKKTNGDKFREMMTDENIAKMYFCAVYDDCPDCPLYKIVECENINTRLEWLRSESEKDVGTD